MLHEPAVPLEKDLAADSKMRDGVKMFAVYAAVYAGFVAINLIKPSLMEKIIVFGLNLATVYGFGLIVFALILAMIYNRMCVKHETRHQAPAERKETA